MGDLGLGWGGLVDWGSGLVGWGGLVNWSWVWDWFISWGRVRLVSFSFWVMWDSFVGYISDETVVVISGVGDSLDTAIGKVYLV